VTTTAAAVSAALRRSGFNPVGTRSREGLYVHGGPSRATFSKGMPVTVSSTVLNEADAATLLDMACEALTGKGYSVDRFHPHLAHVTKE
jgi:hypothetical protein